MALQKFLDSAGREAYKDDKGMVYTTGGSTATNYNVNDWNTRQSQKYGSSSSSSSDNNFSNTINQAIELSRKAAKPAMSSLQSTIKPTETAYNTKISQQEANKQPLVDRYNSLIDTIKGNQTISENRQTLATRNELGKRGVPLTSGVAEQEVVNAVNPITQQYTGLIQDTGYQREADVKAITDTITNLGLDKQTEIAAINNAIAQLQSGASTQGITLGTNLYNTNLNQSNLEKQQAIADKIYQETTLPESRLLQRKAEKELASTGNPTAEEWLKAILGQGTPQSSGSSFIGPTQSTKKSLDSFIYS